MTDGVTTTPRHQVRATLLATMPDADGPERFVVIERADEGRAEFRVDLPGTTVWRRMFPLHGNAVGFVAQGLKKNCDGSFAWLDANGNWHAGLVEIKRTVKNKELAKARVQLESGLLRLCIVLDFLGIGPAQWHARLACSKVLADGRMSPDPGLLRHHVAASTQPPDLRTAPIDFAELGIQAGFDIVLGQLQDDILTGSITLP